MSYSPFDRIHERLDELESAIEKLEKRLDATDATEPADVWPDDENHRLGPNGEKLLAIKGETSCRFCYYDIFKVNCNGVECAVGGHWQLAGDRK